MQFHTVPRLEAPLPVPALSKEEKQALAPYRELILKRRRLNHLPQNVFVKGLAKGLVSTFNLSLRGLVLVFPLIRLWGKGQPDAPRNTKNKQLSSTEQDWLKESQSKFKPWALRHELGHAMANYLIDKPTVAVISDTGRKSIFGKLFYKLSCFNKSMRKTPSPKEIQNKAPNPSSRGGATIAFSSSLSTRKDLKQSWLFSLGGLVATHGSPGMTEDQAETPLYKVKYWTTLGKALLYGAISDLHHIASTLRDAIKVGWIKHNASMPQAISTLRNDYYQTTYPLSEGVISDKTVDTYDEAVRNKVINTVNLPEVREAYDTLARVFQKIPEKAWLELENEVKKTGYKVGPRRIRRWMTKVLKANGVNIRQLKRELKAYTSKPFPNKAPAKSSG